MMSRLGLEAMMSRHGLGRFGPRSSSVIDLKHFPVITLRQKLSSCSVERSGRTL